MKNVLRIAISIICLLGNLYILHSQQIIGSKMPFLEQLPTNEIIEIYQDTRGYMWIGTTDGLVRYDGYNTQVFRSDYAHPGLLFDNYVSTVSENEQYIWIGTAKGLNLLDKDTWQIIPFPDDRMHGIEIRYVLRDEDGAMWIAAHGDLYKCDSSLSLSEPYKFGRTFNSLYKDRKGDIWALIWNGGLSKLYIIKEKYTRKYLKSIPQL